MVPLAGSGAFGLSVIYFGTLIIFGIPFLRNLPVVGSERLGAAASERPWVAFAYLGGVFFALPLLLLGLSMLF